MERMARIFWKVLLFLVIGFWGCWLYSELTYSPQASHAFSNVPESSR